MSRLAEIETFVAVMESGSLSSAAERLDIAVSAVSKRINALEHRLGVRLANRSTRGFAPTHEGRDYYRRCVRLLADLAEADAAVRGSDGPLRGAIRIAAPLSFGIRYLSPVLNAFAALHPQLDFELDLSDRRVNLIDDGFDLAVRIGFLEDSRLVAIKLFEAEHALAASPAYLDAHGRPQHPEQLSNHKTLAYRLRSGPSLWRYATAHGKGSVRVHPRIVSTNGDVLVEAAKQGLGIVLEPVFLLGQALQSGELETLLDDYRWFDEMAAYVIFPRARALPARVRALVDHLREAFASPLPWSSPVVAASSNTE